MVQQIKDLYTIGGLAQGYVMFPNSKSFLHFCKKRNITNKYYYLNYSIQKENCLIFPAYFFLDKKEKPICWKLLKDKAECLQYIDEDMNDNPEKRQILTQFKTFIETS